MLIFQNFQYMTIILFNRRMIKDVKQNIQWKLKARLDALFKKKFFLNIELNMNAALLKK